MSKIKIINALKKYNSFLITAHVNPDPDALCSELALASVLRKLGKRVTIINEAPLKSRLKFFPGSAQVKAAAKVKRVSYEAAIILDCGDFDRIGKVKKFVKGDKPILNIDHHITNTKFGSIDLVDARASSTGELLFTLFKEAGWPIDKNIAFNIYSAILTDTGSFRYDNTTSQTHAIVSELLEFPISPNAIFRRIYEAMPMKDITGFINVLNSFEALYGDEVICVELRRKDTARFSQDFDLRDAIFKFVRAIHGVKAYVILTEVARNKTRINMRSNGKVNVAKIARTFNGGGHKNASGCLIEKNLSQARKEILKEIKEKI